MVISILNTFIFFVSRLLKKNFKNVCITPHNYLTFVIELRMNKFKNRTWNNRKVSTNAKKARRHSFHHHRSL